MKVYINGPGHMTKMAAMPVYGKNHKKIFLLWNWWTYFNQTWYMYVALGTVAHHSVYKSYNLGLTLTYFTARSILVI